MLGPAEPRVDRQRDLAVSGFRDVEARHLAPRIRLRFTPGVTPPQREAGEPCFLFDLAKRCSEGLLARLDETFREIPIAIRAQHEAMPSAVQSAQHRGPR